MSLSETPNSLRDVGTFSPSAIMDRTNCAIDDPFDELLNEHNTAVTNSSQCVADHFLLS